MSDIRLFKPADGAAALEFEKVWCANCAGNAGSKICPVLFRATALDPTDVAFPRAWRIGEDGPECTAFEPALRAVGFDRAAFERQGFAKGDGR